MEQNKFKESEKFEQESQRNPLNNDNHKKQSAINSIKSQVGYRDIDEKNDKMRDEPEQEQKNLPQKEDTKNQPESLQVQSGDIQDSTLNEFQKEKIRNEQNRPKQDNTENSDPLKNYIS